MKPGGGIRATLARAGRADGDRFLVALAAGALLFGLLNVAEPRTDEWFAGASLWTARTAAGLLQASGLEVDRNGNIVSHAGGFGIYVHYLCTGWPMALVMFIGLVALPGRRVPKLLSAVVGVAVLLAMNQLRLVGLFWIGLNSPRAFDFAHRWIGEPAMLLCIGAIWAVWLRYGPQAGAAS